MVGVRRDAGPVVAFDLDSDGHHPSYLEYLAKRWLLRRPGRELVVVVAEDFPGKHPGVVALTTPHQVRFHTVKRPVPPKVLRGPLVPLSQGLMQWRLLQRTVRALRARHAIVMYLDQMLQGPLALGLRPACPLSGIYFRPAFHYPALGHRESPSEANRSRRQRVTVRSAIQRDNIHTLWTLDPYAVPYLQQLGARQRVFALADPVPEEPVDTATIKVLRERYGLRQDRLTLLLFGALTERKGVRLALDAMAAATESIPQPLTALVVGRAPAAFEGELKAAMARAEAAGVRVVRHSAFVAEHEVQAHFSVADVVLAPYQRHVGSSGIAIRAARAQTPLLASDYGMLGESVRQHRLGLAVDASSVTALTQGLVTLIGEAHGQRADRQTAWDLAGMTRFASQNTATAFADTLIDVTTDR